MCRKSFKIADIASVVLDIASVVDVASVVVVVVVAVIFVVVVVIVFFSAPLLRCKQSMADLLWLYCLVVHGSDNFLLEVKLVRIGVVVDLWLRLHKEVTCG